MNSPLSQEIHLLDYWQVITKRKFLVLLCVLITLSTVASYNYIVDPVYLATSRLLIDADRPSSSSISGTSMAYDMFQMQNTEVETHLDLITSFPVLEKVYASVFRKKVEPEALPVEEESIPLIKKVLLLIMQYVSTARYSILDLIDSDKEVIELLENNPALNDHYKILRLRKRVKTQQVKLTRLVDLNVEDKNPKRAMQLANAFAENYIEYTRSSRFDATKVAIDWLSKQMEDMKEQINMSEKKFFQFKEQEGIFSIEGKQNIHVQKIGQLTGAYSTARSKRLTLSAALNELTHILNTKEYDKIAFTILGNPLVEQLHRDLVAQEIELAGLKNTFNYQHASIIALENKIEQTRQTFEEELIKTRSRLQSEYQVLNNEEKTLESTIQQFESEALDLTKQEMQYTLLEREVEANKVLYDLLFKNFTDANVTKAMPATNIILLEKASYPLRPIKPNKVLNFILGTILSLMIGVGLCFFLEYIDRTINSSNDLEKWLELPVLTVIPKIATKKY